MPVERIPAQYELRRTGAWRQLATGTLACPSCDAPILPDGAMAMPDPLSCGYCSHSGAVRDFLTLGEPTRPAHVAVRVRGLPFG